MTRKDLIILGTLVNAGLIAGLFMLAVNSDDDKLSEPTELTQNVVEVKPTEAAQEVALLTPQTQQYQQSVPTAGIQTVPGDEVDSALKELAASNTAQMIVIDDLDDEQSTKEETSKEKPVTTVTAIETPEKEGSKKDEKYVDVTVKKGDSLDKIARANGTTVAAIKDANNLKSDKLKIGKVLKIPVNSKKKKNNATNILISEKKNVSKDISEGDKEYYTVKSGDNPWKIAKKFHIKVDELLQLNQLDEEKARNLKIGDKLRVK